MAKTEQERKSKNEEDRKSKNEQDRQLSRELEMSFPASDPPAATQPGSGITGPEATSLKRRPTKGRINRRVDRSSAIDREYETERPSVRRSGTPQRPPRAFSRLIQEIRPPQGRPSLYNPAPPIGKTYAGCRRTGG